METKSGGRSCTPSLIMPSEDYRDFETSPNASSCAYTPLPRDAGGVINASAYRAFMLTAASSEFSDENYRKIADRNLNFVLRVTRTQMAPGLTLRTKIEILSITFIPVLS